MESTIRALIVPLSERLIKQLTQVQEKSAHKPLDLFTLELVVSKLLAQFALSLLAGLIQLWHGCGNAPSPVTCEACGSALTVQNYLRRPVVCCFGRFAYERAYYYCRACHRSRLPLDEALGVGAREYSPRLARVLAYLSAHLSFGTVEHAVRECYELELNHETIRQVAEEVGSEARDWEERERARYEKGAPAPRPAATRPKTWVIECDGKQVGLQDGRWQEVKIGLIYELGARVEPYSGRHELLKREIRSAALWLGRGAPHTSGWRCGGPGCARATGSWPWPTGHMLWSRSFRSSRRRRPVSVTSITWPNASMPLGSCASGRRADRVRTGRGPSCTS